jgi:CDP-diacylglycerol--glycerol-3-phosphate 3-phosphatidyltransferase
MPSIYGLKPRFQALLRPLVPVLARAGLTPNAVTLAALAGSIIVGVVIACVTAPATEGLLVIFPPPPRTAVLLLLPFWLAVRMALNALDGMMARELHQASRLGGALNEIGDVLADVALYLPLALVHRPSLWPVVAFTLGAALTEFCGVLGVALGARRQYGGPMGKSDRASLVGALALATAVAPRALAAWPWIFAAAAALAALTCWNRVCASLASAPPHDAGSTT